MRAVAGVAALPIQGLIGLLPSDPVGAEPHSWPWRRPGRALTPLSIRQPASGSTISLPGVSMNLGIEIGGTKLQLVLGDDGGVITERRRLAVDPSKGAAGIRDQIEQALPELLGGRRVARAGVGFGGPVDWKAG